MIRAGAFEFGNAQLLRSIHVREGEVAMGLLGTENQLVWFEDIMHKSEELQGRDVRLSARVYPTKDRTRKALSHLNDVALSQPQCVLQLVTQVSATVTEVIAGQASTYFKWLSGRNVSRIKRIELLEPRSVAALAPWGYSSTGAYVGAGELLAFNAEVLELRSAGSRALVSFSQRWAIPVQNLLHLLVQPNFLARMILHSFSIMEYIDSKEVSRQERRVVVYLNQGHTLDDFFTELSYLVSTYVQPA